MSAYFLNLRYRGGRTEASSPTFNINHRNLLFCTTAGRDVRSYVFEVCKTHFHNS